VPLSLVLAAFPPELAELGDSPPPGWRVATAGVGAIEAAASTARLVSEHRPERVLFLGTCGAYDARLAVGDLLLASAAITTSLDEVEGRAFRPNLERVRYPATWTPALPFPSHDVAVPPAITRTAEGAHRLAALGAAEHLELAGVFAACHQARVPVAGALAVANRVGPTAHEEWLANHVRVSRALVESLRSVLAG
jgi:purine-nucleoside phosphorylase